METKLASATSMQVSRAQQRHYDLENQIMNQLRDLTLAQKEALASKMPAIVDEL